MARVEDCQVAVAAGAGQGAHLVGGGQSQVQPHCTAEITDIHGAGGPGPPALHRRWCNDSRNVMPESSRTAQQKVQTMK